MLNEFANNAISLLEALFSQRVDKRAKRQALRKDHKSPPRPFLK